MDPVDVPKYFSCSGDIIKLMLHTANDASLVMRLMLKLQVVPLTKQLTSFSGNLWTRTMRGARAERIEYLLLHEFHAAKYILPEKKAMESGGPGSGPGKKGARVSVGIPDGEEGDERGGAVGGHARSRAKAAYAGGLVLEPKKGLYDTYFTYIVQSISQFITFSYCCNRYVLLLDFNSLYPSIIQEYNLCFTTINWTQYMPDPAVTKGPNVATAAIKQEEGEEEAGDGDLVLEDNPAAFDKKLAPLPDGTAANGILPRVIRNLVEKRKQVKALLKKEIDPARRLQYDIRQKALKLTANSMYGCLGFSFSRFYARPIAALVTAMGREALQRTVNLATNQVDRIALFLRFTVLMTFYSHDRCN